MHAIKSRIGPLIRLVTEVGQKAGVTLAPHSFYAEYPDLAFLKRETFWRRPMSMVGVRGVEIPPQLEFVRRCCEPFAAQLAAGDIHPRAVERNGEMGFGAIEAEFLYCFVRSHKPRRIVQIGCGVSTAVILRAADDEGYKPEVVCVEPYPTAMLREEARAGRLRLVEEIAQKAPLEVLTGLDAGDLLFIDSTHTVRLGSEVVRIVLEVLPRLAPGVMVHFHDILYPYDYPIAALTRELFYNREAVLLLAFLCMNPSYTITASLSMLHHAAESDLRAIFPTYRPCRLENGMLASEGGEGHMPSSLYLTRLP